MTVPKSHSVPATVFPPVARECVQSSMRDPSSERLSLCQKRNTEGPSIPTNQVSAYPQAIALDLITVQRCQEALRRPPFGVPMYKLVQIIGTKAPRVEKLNHYLLRLMLV